MKLQIIRNMKNGGEKFIRTVAISSSENNRLEEVTQAAILGQAA